MKSNLKIISAFLVLVICPYLLPNSASAAGRTNQSATNTVLNGKGAPTTKIGINGDFYIDVLTFNMYGPKVNNKWPSPTSLKGPAGVNGSEGKQGDKGSTGTGNSGAKGEIGDQGLQGEKGLQGDKGEKGDKGERGEKGDKGETGAQGLTGLTGANGIQGATGATGSQGLRGETGLAGATGSQGLKGDTGLTGATGSQGLKGDTGLTGAKGDTGSTGSQGLKGDTGLTGAKGDSGTNGVNGTNGSNGAKGDTGATGSTGATGATGATGPSNVYVGSVSFISKLQGSAGTSITSSPFATLKAGKSYLFDVIIWGRSASTNPTLKFSISTVGSGPTVNSYWFASSIQTYRDNLDKREYSFLGRVAIDASSYGSDFQLTVSVTSAYFIDSSEEITFSGGFAGQLVGSISNG